jgi:hypothetical protein
MNKQKQKKNKDWTEEDFERVIYSDEYTIAGEGIWGRGAGGDGGSRDGNRGRVCRDSDGSAVVEISTTSKGAEQIRLR